MINIQLNIDENEQMSSCMNASLHGAPGNHAVSIDTCAPIPDHLSTQDEIKTYLEEQLKPLSDQGWEFNIVVGSASD